MMALAGVAFVGYGLVFLVLALIGSGFELGVHMLDDLTRAELAGINSEAVYYIIHLHSPSLDSSWSSTQIPSRNRPWINKVCGTLSLLPQVLRSSILIAPVRYWLQQRRLAL